MANIFAEIFGSSGKAALFFGGQWWLVGLFIIFLMAVFLYKANFGADAMAIFVFSAFTFASIDGVFQIPANWIVAIVVIVSIFVGYSLNKFLRG